MGKFEAQSVNSSWWAGDIEDIFEKILAVHVLRGWEVKKASPKLIFFLIKSALSKRIV